MIDYKKSKYANLFIIGSFAFSLLVGIVLITISGSFLNNGVENPLFLLGCFCYIIIHEVIHLIFMKTFSKENIHISFKKHMNQQFVTFRIRMQINLPIHMITSHDIVFDGVYSTFLDA